MSLRKQINPSHPVFGDGYRMLEDNDIIIFGDQTACVSCLLSMNGDRWIIINEHWGNIIGKTVKYACEETSDVDGNERVFRRRNN